MSLGMIGAGSSMKAAIAEADWHEAERRRARIVLGARAGALDEITRKLAKETPYSFRQWWPRVFRRMRNGDLAARIYTTELDAMRDTHRRGGRYLR